MFVSCEQARRQDYESHCETPTGEAAGRRRHSAPTALRPVREYRWNFESVTALIDLAPNMTHPSTFVSCCLSSATLTAATDTYRTSTKTALLISHPPRPYNKWQRRRSLLFKHGRISAMELQDTRYDYGSRYGYEDTGHRE